MMEIPMIQELLPRPRESRRVVPAHQSRERFPPLNRQPLELFEQCGFN
jgi:hypothetical protein